VDGPDPFADPVTRRAILDARSARAGHRAAAHSAHVHSSPASAAAEGTA
jgi:hypothetical protein